MLNLIVSTSEGQERTVMTSDIQGRTGAFSDLHGRTEVHSNVQGRKRRTLMYRDVQRCTET